MEEAGVRVRYAPSPMGFLLLAKCQNSNVLIYLFAKHYHGDFAFTRIWRLPMLSANVEGGEESQLGIICAGWEKFGTWWISTVKVRGTMVTYRQKGGSTQSSLLELLGSGAGFTKVLLYQLRSCRQRRKSQERLASHRCITPNVAYLTPGEIAEKKRRDCLMWSFYAVPEGKHYNDKDTWSGVRSMLSLRILGDWVIVIEWHSNLYFAVVVDESFGN